MATAKAKSVDSDQMPLYEASDQDLQCVPLNHFSF